ncbi:MAG: phosphoribosyltransferase family protein [Planctomycetota bacterium]|nr:phosphoribosyltransferase family protein [Planctomycetota bacterium]
MSRGTAGHGLYAPRPPLPPGLRLLFTAEEINARLDCLAAVAAAKVAVFENPLAVCVLKGAFVFCADLIRRINVGMDVTFVRAASYNRGTVPSDRVRISFEPPASEVRGRGVLLVEDIVDSGRTIRAVRRRLASRGASIACAIALLRRRGGAAGDLVDAAGFEIGREFVVGYGLDLDGKYRNLPYLASIEGEMR